MDSRLQRRIKWWKEQLKKKKKGKPRDTDATTKETKPCSEELDSELEDLVEDSLTVEDTTPIRKHDRKRKRTSGSISQDVSLKKKKRESTSAVSDVAATDSTAKKKYILFVGNIPFSAIAEEITAHFQRAGIKVDNFRLLTKKSGSSKGCGFMDLNSSKQMQAGLKLHHTKFGDRRVNIELSSGGGGKNEERMKKIKARNRRLRQEKAKKRKMLKKSKTVDEIVTSK